MPGLRLGFAPLIASDLASKSRTIKRFVEAGADLTQADTVVGLDGWSADTADPRPGSNRPAAPAVLTVRNALPADLALPDAVRPVLQGPRRAQGGKGASEPAIFGCEYYRFAIHSLIQWQFRKNINHARQGCLHARVGEYFERLLPQFVALGVMYEFRPEIRCKAYNAHVFDV